MDVRWALKELGIDDDVAIDAERLRRAYLRKVRAHSPERDPEGFKRAREAYDFLSRVPWAWQSQRPERDASAGGALVLEARAAVAPSVSEPAVVSIPLPEEPSLAPAALLAVRPVELEPEVAAALGAWQELRELQFGTAPTRAAALIIKILGAPASVDLPLPSPHACSEVALQLCELGNVVLAEELVAAFEARIRRDGAKAGLISPPVAGRLKLLSELFALKNRVSRELVMALAGGVRAENMLEAADAVRSASITDGQQFHRVLGRYAPSLYSVVRSFAETRRTSSPRTFSPGNGYAIAMLVVVLARLLPVLVSNTPPSHSAVEAPAPPVVFQPDPPRPPASPPAAGAESEAARKRILVVEQSIDAHIAANECEALSRLWPDYVSLLRSLRLAPAEMLHYQELQRRASGACREFAFTFAETP